MGLFFQLRFLAPHTCSFVVAGTKFLGAKPQYFVALRHFLIFGTPHVRLSAAWRGILCCQLSYPEALKQVVDEDGVPGLFLRGLQTRILVNALQGALFAVAWKYFQELIRSGGSP